MTFSDVIGMTQNHPDVFLELELYDSVLFFIIDRL